MSDNNSTSTQDLELARNMARASREVSEDIDPELRRKVALNLGRKAAKELIQAVKKRTLEQREAQSTDSNN